MVFWREKPKRVAGQSSAIAAASGANASRRFNRMPSPLPKRLSFGREQRIKQSRDFARARAQGQRLAQGTLVANWLKLSAASTTRLGVVTSSKIGGAVVRSRARRLLREVFRAHQNDLRQPVDLVLVARPSIAGKKFYEVEKDFMAALQKAGLLAQRS